MRLTDDDHARWTQAGRDAYTAGLKRVPAWDPATADALGHLSRMAAGASPVGQAWTAGWDAARADAHARH